jgi:hypothetical protein
MTMQAWTTGVALRHASEAPQRPRLREPQGADELAVAGVDTRSAVQLLDRLLEAAPCQSAQLSASDRDALLAALHRRLWGDRIVCSLRCPACEAMYDLSFELSQLQRQLAEQGEAGRTLGLRCIADSQGLRFTLPSADEEAAAAQSGLNAGMARLANGIADDECIDTETLGERLEGLAPLLDIDLNAPCAECGHSQLARFDIQSFVLQRLLDEREGVLSDVHALASGYGWSLGEIVGLPRSLRRSLVQRLGASPADWG